jgi:glycogen synthase
MRALVISNLYPPDFIGGYELCCRQVVDGLLARGHDIHVLTAVPRVPCPSADHVSRLLKLTNCYDAYGILHSRPLARHLSNAKASLISAHNVHVLNETLARLNPDVVYLWNLFGLGGLGLIGALGYLDIPWVWYLGDCVPRMLCSIGSQVLPALAEQFSRQVRGIYMPVSDRVVHEIESAGVRLNGEVETTPNWVLGAQPPRRTEFFRPGKTLRIVSSGQMGRHKGIDLLIEAAAILRRRGLENFAIDLYGKLTDPTLAALTATHGVEDLVTFRGLCPQTELVEHYERHEYDVFAFPTWEREPFGCAPLEASAYGCVMVMTQCCGIGEWFVNGVHCLKAARTAAAFADVFADIMTGKIALEPLARRASAVVWRDFHIDALLPRIESALGRAARRPSDPAGTPDEAFRLATLAERLMQSLVQEQYAGAA